ncbi:unnamed protein product [Ixodes pacificus]
MRTKFATYFSLRKFHNTLEVNLGARYLQTSFVEFKFAHVLYTVSAHV